jgi:hypothetical protein
MIERKKELIKRLEDNEKHRKGKLELLALNALDETRFKEIVQHFEKGPLAIVNEGLLIYLSTEEKEKLCKIIHGVLEQRGGYWITADIYLKVSNLQVADPGLDERTKRFFEEHNVEANRFESFEKAEAFFNRMGFVIDKEADIDFSTLSAFPYLAKNIKPEDQEKWKKLGKIHTTWKLRVAD